MGRGREAHGHRHPPVSFPLALRWYVFAVVFREALNVWLLAFQVLTRVVNCVPPFLRASFFVNAVCSLFMIFLLGKHKGKPSRFWVYPCVFLCMFVIYFWVGLTISSFLYLCICQRFCWLQFGLVLVRYFPLHFSVGGWVFLCVWF